MPTALETERSFLSTLFLPRKNYWRVAVSECFRRLYGRFGYLKSRKTPLMYQTHLLDGTHEVTLALSQALAFWIWRQLNGAKKRNASSLERYPEGRIIRDARAEADHRRSHDAGPCLSQEGRDCAASFARERADYLHSRRRLALLDRRG